VYTNFSRKTAAKVVGIQYCTGWAKRWVYVKPLSIDKWVVTNLFHSMDIV